MVTFVMALQHANEDVEKMILGNKCDMEDKRQVSKERGDTVSRAALWAQFDSVSWEEDVVSVELSRACVQRTLRCGRGLVSLGQSPTGGGPGQEQTFISDFNF